ncbi:MAG: hypothetical protein IJZ96_04055 [Lachnospiraceae bacterium]|nr:hypothetical protein [Lachnospiraceae bacterium]
MGKYNFMSQELFDFEGRILKDENIAYLGFTNSKVSFFCKGKGVRCFIKSNITEPVNMAGLSVYIDDKIIYRETLVIDKEEGWYDLCQLPDDEVHMVTIFKLTEAAMSYVALVELEICEGELVKGKFPEKPELKLEFIGDSITCGYGVLGEPESEYTIREENGLLTYAQVAADVLEARARFFSVSGYGAFVDYEGNIEGNVPRLYPYVNWFADKEILYDYKEYVPDVIVINLGTNDSGHIHKDWVQEGFIKSYSGFIVRLKEIYPDAKILCICGTLCDIMFEWIEKAICVCEERGVKDIYMRRLPYHNVAEDGMASQHPSITTHKKDGARVADFIREIIN